MPIYNIDPQHTEIAHEELGQLTDVTWKIIDGGQVWFEEKSDAVYLAFLLPPKALTLATNAAAPAPASR
jgi:hypothetical protein